MTTLGHIARESSDITRLAQFYKQLFGFEEIESPDFGDLKVIWLNLPGAFAMHIIQKNPSTNLPESPYSATSAVRDPSHLPMGHHICFSVSNFDSFLRSLKEKGIETFQKSLPDGKVKQVFFFDPDGMFQLTDSQIFRKRIRGSKPSGDLNLLKFGVSILIE